jgi:hypothetical protein
VGSAASTLLIPALSACVPVGGQSADPGWIDSVSASYAQNQVATLTLPSGFSTAKLLVAIVANDGPDSNTTETTAVFGGTTHLRWVRHAHVSARQDWEAGTDSIDVYGASSAEIWTAAPPSGWRPGGKTVTEISNQPNTGDDGGVITLAAWSNGRLGHIHTLDGLNSRPEHQLMALDGSSASIYAAVFNGRANASFNPASGYQFTVTRHAGDDTAGVIASDNRNLGASLQNIGYASTPSPGDYWEMAIVEVVPS